MNNKETLDNFSNESIGAINFFLNFFYRKYHQNTPNVINVNVIFGNFKYFDDIFYR